MLEKPQRWYNLLSVHIRSFLHLSSQPAFASQMFHYAHFHPSLVSSCHHEKLSEIIIGIFAFCTMTGMIALDK